MSYVGRRYDGLKPDDARIDKIMCKVYSATLYSLHTPVLQTFMFMIGGPFICECAGTKCELQICAVRVHSIIYFHFVPTYDLDVGGIVAVCVSI